MKKTKIVSYLLSAVIAFGLVPNAMAEETPVYTYDDNNGETVNVTQSELIAGNWNVDYMSHLPVEQFEDFPVKLDKQVYGSAQLRINAVYLKNVRADEEVTFSVVDRNTNEVFYSHNFTANTEDLEIENIPMDKTFNLIVKSVYEGIETQNVAVIETYYGEATMPDNVTTRTNMAENIGESATKVRVKDMTLGTVYSENVDGTISTNDNAVIITPEQLPELYEEIEDEHLYNVQTNASGEIYLGFISKNEKYNCNYIFVPTYNYHTLKEYESMLKMRSTFAYDYSTKDEIVLALDTNLKTIDYLSDQYMHLYYGEANDKKPIRIYRLFIQNTGNYTIKAYSNDDFNLYYGTSIPTDYSNIEAAPHPTTWNKFSDPSLKTLGLADDQWLYVACEIGYAGDIVLNISYTGGSDNVTNSLYEANIQNVPALMDVLINSAIDYCDDVDVFMINNEVSGNYSFVLSNLYPVTDTPKTRTLEIQFYTCDTDGFFFYVDEEGNEPHTVPRGETGIFDFNLPTKERAPYFVSIRAVSIYESAGNYSLKMLTPSSPDPYEANENYRTATDITSFTSPITDATLAKGDMDYYKFTVGAGGAIANIQVSSSCKQIRAIELYGLNSDIDITGTLTGTVSTINNAVLTGNETYILVVKRSNTSNYCPGHPYTLTWNIEEQPYFAATVNSAIVITVVENDSTSNLTTIKEQVASNMTFTLNGEAVATETAINDMVLYYMNGTEKIALTQDSLTGLAVGNYTLTAEYNGVEATGEAITLTITQAVTGQVIELSTITPVDALDIAWDWSACAEMVANSRLTREGSAASTMDALDATLAVYQSIYGTDFTEDNLWETYERVTLANAAKATRYIYTSGSTSGATFTPKTIINNEESFTSMLGEGKAAIMLLTSISTPNDLTKARYVVITGVDTISHKYQIIDPTANNVARQWIDISLFENGGVLGNTDLKFTGMVVEYR